MTRKEQFDNAVSAYLSDIKHKCVSDKTYSNYTKCLNYFEDFLFAESSESDPTADAVRSWRDSLLEKGLSPSTVKQYLVELRAFFTFATDEELHHTPFFEKNPVSNKLYPRVSESKKPYDRILSNDDIKLLWVNKPLAQGRKYWPRNYAIITLLLDGKIRNAELLDLTLNDIDFEHKEAVIRKGKGNKYRVVTLSDITLSAIRLYLESGFRPDYCTGADYLFGTVASHTFGGNNKVASEKWHRGSSQWLSKLVESHVRAVTGKEGFRTHSMRHNGAIIDLNNGASLERIQSELGHSSVTTTEIYAGRLQPVRHAREMEDVIAVRDEWARKNMMALAASAN